MDELQEQFSKALKGLIDKAKSKKNMIEYKEINDAFAGIELSEDKMDAILEFLEKSNIDVLHGSADEEVEELLLESDDDLLFR